MRNFHDKESRKRIEMINQALNMKHRSEPYDYTKTEDVKQAFMYTVAEYMDYQNYASVLDDLLEKYDESMEYYDPITWLGNVEDDVKHDRKTLKAYSSLRKAKEDMSALSGRSEKEVIKLTRLLLSGNKEFRIAIFGNAYIFNEDNMEEIIEASWESMDTYSVEESRDLFLELMGEYFDIEDEMSCRKNQIEKTLSDVDEMSKDTPF